jgi:NADPH:quinone reductase-like Zn-dependent oxidoreductase
MKAVVMECYGTPEVLELRDVATPTPRADEVLVRVLAASVNDWDWGMLRGTPFIIRILNGLFTPKVRVIGCDIAGRVEAVGEDVKAFRRVMRSTAICPRAVSARLRSMPVRRKRPSGENHPV